MAPKVLLLSSKLGFNKLHEELVPILDGMKLTYALEHSQETGRKALEALQPEYLFVENWLPLKSPPDQGVPKVKGREGVSVVSIPGLTGLPVSESFAEVHGLVSEAVATRPTLKIGVFYRSRTGMPKEHKEFYAKIPQVFGVYGYPFTQANLAKFRKTLQRLSVESSP